MHQVATDCDPALALPAVVAAQLRRPGRVAGVDDGGGGRSGVVAALLAWLQLHLVYTLQRRSTSTGHSRREAYCRSSPSRLLVHFTHTEGRQADVSPIMTITTSAPWFTPPMPALMHCSSFMRRCTSCWTWPGSWACCPSAAAVPAASASPPGFPAWPVRSRPRRPAAASWSTLLVRAWS